MANPDDRKYTKQHEWCKVEGNTVTVGVTDYAQKALTDIVFVELPKLGTKVEREKPMCVLESVKNVSDIFAPVSGEVVEVNTELLSTPELVNKEPFGRGWIAKIKLADEKELHALMDSKQYDAFVEEEERK